MDRTLSVLGALLTIALLPLLLEAQVLDTLPVQRPSKAEGTHFFVGYMENEISIQQSGLRLRLLIASAYPNRVRVRFPDGAEKEYQLSANQTLPLLLPDSLEVRQSETPLRRAIEVLSELPVSVFAMSSQYTTSDSYTALPLDMWGTEYTVLSLPNDTYGDGLGTPVDPLDIRQSEFMIIASQDQTEVEFRPPSPTEAGRTANQWHRIQLNRGECFLVKSYPSQQGSGDLTATSIRATKPIAILAGHVRASVPIGLPQRLDSKDHLVEMLLPNNLLGWNYVTVPFATGARLPIGDYLRAVAIYPDTRITVYTERDDFSFTLANAGDTLTLPRVNSPSWWYSTKPFALAQYMTTATVANSINFDPAMVIVVPTQRYVSRCVFQAPANLNDASFSRQFDRHWVNVVCDENASTSLKLDGKRVADSIDPDLPLRKFRSSGMYWAQFPVSPGIHVLHADSGVFTGVLYGMGYTDSYAHILGVTDLSTRDTVLPMLTVVENCGVLSGNAFDTGGSGLATVAIEPDSTNNYELRITEQTGERIGFRAIVLDPYQDASISIIIRDGAGNGIRYRYRYRAPVVDLSPRPVRFQATTIGETLCRNVTLRNFSFRDTLSIESVSFARGGNGVYTLSGTLPIVCPPRREVSVQLCYTATVDGIVRDTLIWDIGCGRTYRQPIEGRTPRPDLSTSDIDFGDVIVGRTRCQRAALINTGTEPIAIEQIHADSSAQMFAFTFPALPQTLQPGDTLYVDVCFTPTDTGLIVLQVDVANDKMLPTRFMLRGRGIRAALFAEPLHCGSQRVGVRFDTLARIHNRGTADASIRYRQQTGDAQSILHSLRPGDSLIIPRSSNIGLPIRFSPKSVGATTAELEFELDDGSVMRLEINGYGTLPRIEMSDTTIGPVTLGQKRTYSVVILHSYGNEPLTVDSLWLGGPDRNAFQFVTFPSVPLTIPAGQALTIPIVFEPTRVGLHQAILSVIHDAQPNYVRGLSTSQLQGIGIAPDTSGGGSSDTTEIVDTINFRFEVEYNESPLRCDALELILTAENTGTAQLQFTAAELIERGQPISILHRFPSSLARGDKTRIRIVLPPPHDKRDIVVRVVANDTLIRQRVVRINPIGGLSALRIESVDGRIDSTVMLDLQGSFEPGSSSQVDVTLTMHIPAELVEYQGGITLPVVLTCDGSQRTVYATLAISADTYVADWTVPPFSTTCQWQLIVPVRLLFSVLPRGTVQAHISAGSCYDDDSATATVTTGTVCGHSIRGVQLSGAVIRSVSPNPFSEHLHLNVEVYSPQALELWLYDGSGRKIFARHTPYLQTGQHVVIFDTGVLPSGWYLLVVETADGHRMKLCCLFKP